MIGVGESIRSSHLAGTSTEQNGIIGEKVVELKSLTRIPEDVIPDKCSHVIPANFGKFVDDLSP